MHSSGLCPICPVQFKISNLCHLWLRGREYRGSSMTPKRRPFYHVSFLLPYNTSLKNAMWGPVVRLIGAQSTQDGGCSTLHIKLLPDPHYQQRTGQMVPIIRHLFWMICLHFNRVVCMQLSSSGVYTTSSTSAFKGRQTFCTGNDNATQSHKCVISWCATSPVESCELLHFGNYKIRELQLSAIQLLSFCLRIPLGPQARPGVKDIEYQTNISCFSAVISLPFSPAWVHFAQLKSRSWHRDHLPSLWLLHSQVQGLQASHPDLCRVLSYVAEKQTAVTDSLEWFHGEHN